MKGHVYHEDELIAARVLADHGYNVLMTPESGGLWVSNVVNKKGKPVNKYAEGYIGNQKYEQLTVGEDSTNLDGGSNKALDHGVETGSYLASQYSGIVGERNLPLTPKALISRCIYNKKTWIMQTKF